jgi:hypothetical protein
MWYEVITKDSKVILITSSLLLAKYKRMLWGNAYVWAIDTKGGTTKCFPVN